MAQTIKTKTFCWNGYWIFLHSRISSVPLQSPCLRNPFSTIFKQCFGLVYINLNIIKSLFLLIESKTSKSRCVRCTLWQGKYYTREISFGCLHLQFGRTRSLSSLYPSIFVYVLHILLALLGLHSIVYVWNRK